MLNLVCGQKQTSCKQISEFKRRVGIMTIVSLALALLIITNSAQASFTSANHNMYLLNDSSPSTVQSRVKLVGSANARLVNIGWEITEPYAASKALTNPRQNHIQPLPAVPAAVLMVLSGFLCVSLFRDRSFWLAALAGLLWAGHTGIQTVPQLAKHLCSQTPANRYPTAAAVKFYLRRNATRPRCDMEGTAYIGLLKYLAGIPRSTNISQPCHPSKHSWAFTQNEYTFKPSQFTATTPLFCPIPAGDRPVRIVAFFTCFLLTLVFDNLSRGPPPCSM